MRENYGKELILDLHECNPEKFTKPLLRKFFKELCKLIDMKAMQLNFWEYKDPEEYAKAPPHLKGISAVQFIETSNVTLHALEDMKCVYLNIFSCKDFETVQAMDFCQKYFEGVCVNTKTIDRI